MRRPWQVWLAFALSAAVMLAALVWVSAVVLRLDREGVEARRGAAFEETVRLALWRMEAVASPVVAREGALPYFAWQSFYPAGRAYTRMFARLESGDVLVPSPLLARPGEYVALHFQLGPDGRLSSPQVPEGNMRDIAESGYLEHRRVEESAGLLAGLDAAALEGYRPQLPMEVRGQRRPVPGATGVAAVQSVPQVPVANAPDLAAQLQQQINTNESIARLRAAQQAAGTSFPHASAADEEVIEQGAMRAVWLGNDLVLLRRILVSDAEYLQGCVLVWPDLSGALLESVRDILPQARLVPVGPEPEGIASSQPIEGSSSGADAARAVHADASSHGDPRRLAALPVRLDPGPMPDAGFEEDSVAPLTLAIAWGAVLVTLLAAGLLLASAVSLGERRDAFVSAVTHELRTPLTTFRMYTEMLDEGMVVEEEKRRTYLGLLRSEAERLGHLVENVLAYSRLERHRARGRIETLLLSELVGELSRRLARRASEVGLELQVDSGSGPEAPSGKALPAVRVHADRDAVERILFNLVDNACKYASSGADRRLHLVVEGASVAVRDHGPGIARDTVGKLFRPFSRGALDAAGGPPGVGLGLALSRRLARGMGGDLSVGRIGPDGAEFVLTLPVAGN